MPFPQSLSIPQVVGGVSRKGCRKACEEPASRISTLPTLNTHHLYCPPYSLAASTTSLLPMHNLITLLCIYKSFYIVYLCMKVILHRLPIFPQSASVIPVFSAFLPRISRVTLIILSHQPLRVFFSSGPATRYLLQ